jgi:hypothetical protein
MPKGSVHVESLAIDAKKVLIYLLKIVLSQ